MSLVVPVYNEQYSIDIFFSHLLTISDHIFAQIERLEIIFIDDGSDDLTIEQIRQHAPTNFDVTIVKLSRNFSKEIALAAGLANASGDAVIPLDVDLQDPTELIPEMIKHWLAGAKMVNAKRRARPEDTFFKRTTSAAFYKLFNMLSDFKIEENVGDFRLLDRELVDVLNEMPERSRFAKGMFAWLGFHPVTIEFSRPARAAGTTKWGAIKLWKLALDGIAGATTLPLRIWTYFGVFISISAISLALLLIISVFIYGIQVPGYASLMVVMLFMFAFNFIALGIIGEYVGRLSVEVRRRPLYVIDEIIKLSGSDIN